MEEQRPPKRLCSTAPSQAKDRRSREPECPGVQHEVPMEAGGPAEPCPPAKPIAYVRPMRCVIPPRESARSSERGRPRGRIRQRADRGPRHRQEGYRQAPEPREWPGHLLGSDLQIQLNNHEEPDHHVEPEARQPLPFHSTGAAVMNGEAPLGPRPSMVQLELNLQDLPWASVSWVAVQQPASVIHPHVAFSPQAGSAWGFLQTLSGTYSYRVPVFGTHTVP
ncbi:proline-rich protein 20A-like [Tupaia chinensis]|uniref:proline-rich protein 20A-like n=1 Tax=Tupaia chinensis TaxID=246437 RepID=UPI0003C8CF6E|nr:proline-rich protein 20A-like [Tupaia chinensis]XP_014440196.1 proline-rich protein 20A-like [Tupaia chinensis]